MKYIKMLGLAAVAAMALMAIVGAGTASATTLCKESKTSGDCASKFPAGTTLEASVETSALLKTSGGTTIATCSNGTVSGKTSNEGSTTETVKGNISSLTWSNCSTTVDTLANGSLEVHHIAGTNNGTVTSNGTEVTINFIGLSCIFKTSNTDIGTLTGGAPATFDISATIPGISGGFCPASGIWSGAYVFTNPSSTLDVAAG
jgi:hypothetical protein